VSEQHPLLEAVAPLAEIVGGELVAAEDMRDGDVPLQWEGEVVGAFRLAPLRGALDRLVAVVERELGAPLADLDRTGKQRAVRLLEERGAFQLRRSIEEIADLMGVSRVTIYTYLDAVRGDPGSV
jgi:hypothetical protein